MQYKNISLAGIYFWEYPRLPRLEHAILIKNAGLSQISV